MPVQRRYDFQLAGKGFMLARGEFKGRAWTRTGRADAPGQRTQADARYGVLPDELDHPEVWDDWSGGMGYAYRRSENANTYHWSENFDARFPRQLVHCQRPLNSVGQMDGFIEFEREDNLRRPGCRKMVAFGYYGARHVNVDGYSLGVLTRAWSEIPASINYVGRAAIFGSFCYLPILEATSFGIFNMIANPITGSHNMPATNFVVAGNRLWRSHGPVGGRFLLQSCAAGADPAATANWTATLVVGDANAEITDLAALEDQLFAGKPDGLYVGDSGGSFYRVIKTPPHLDNFRDLCVHNNAMFGQHSSGVYRYQAQDYYAEVDEVGPNLGTNRSPVKGQIRCLFSNGPWLYGGLWTGSQSWLLAGQETPRGVSWHTLQRFPHVARLHRLYVDANYTVSGGGLQVPNSIWAATDTSIGPTGTAPSYAWPIPINDGNPLASVGVFEPNYVGSARVDLGETDWGAPGTPKVFRAVEVWAENLASTAQWCQLYYSVDGEATRHLLGTVAKSPKDTLYFPSGEGSFVTGQSIALSLESFTASYGVTPVYRAIVLRGALQPRSVDMITAVARIADNLRDRQGAAMRSGATMLRELRDLGNPDRQGLQAHELIDLTGATQWVKVVGRVEEQEVYQPGGEEPEVAATVRMAVLNYAD